MLMIVIMILLNIIELVMNILSGNKDIFLDFEEVVIFL